MSGRDLVVLGTASQAPTRTRNHNGYLLRWDQTHILFDPGEGTQRQLVHAGVSARRIERICLTHLHGDHCLGLPGILHRLAVDRPDPKPVPVHFPASGRPYVERLCDASIGDRIPVQLEPVPPEGGVLVGDGSLHLRALPLDHRVDAVGYRVQEPAGHRFLPERLDALGVRGNDVGELERQGSIVIDGRRVTLDEVTEPRPGLSMAFVMDTRMCDNAVELALGVDLLVCEATYLETEVDLAVAHHHLTAREAATLAREADVGRLVLTHLSSRYPSVDGHLAEAADVFADVTVAEDFDVIPLVARDSRAI